MKLAPNAVHRHEARQYKCSTANNHQSIFNYCNQGVISWYQFALAIKELTGSNCIIKPIPASQYPAPAERPQYSVLDTSKIKDSFNIVIPHWKESLKKCLKLMS